MTSPSFPRPFGRTGLFVSGIGLGCMGMSEFYGAADEAEAVETIHKALDLGITFFDTADMYGCGHNEALVGRALAGRRAGVIVGTKFGIVRDPSNPASRGVSGSRNYVKRACEASLRRLGVETIDLYYQHRVDPQTPIEETVGAMAELVKEGKVRHLGLSEAGVETIRRAHAVHPIAALQTEYSLWSRDVEEAILPTCRELGIAFVAYSPLGRGFLSGAIRDIEALAHDDCRRQSPRFQGENFTRNLAVVRRVAEIAAEKGCTPAQLALAWVLSRGQDIHPIPGTKRRQYLLENVKALEVALSADDLRRIEEAAPAHGIAGPRYSEEGMKAVGK